MIYVSKPYRKCVSCVLPLKDPSGWKVIVAVPWVKFPS